MLGEKISAQGPLLLKLLWQEYFNLECNFLALKQCLRLSQINIKQNTLHIMPSSKFP